MLLPMVDGVLHKLPSLSLLAGVADGIIAGYAAACTATRLAGVVGSEPVSSPSLTSSSMMDVGPTRALALISAADWRTRDWCWLEDRLQLLGASLGLLEQLGMVSSAS